MRLWVLFFLCGVLALQQFSYLPSYYFVICFVMTAVFLQVFLMKKWQVLRLLIASILGFSWCLSFSYHQITWHLPSESEGKTVCLRGYIASIPEESAHGVAFLFAGKKFENHPMHGLFRLSWMNSKDHLKVGDEWNFYVRLKKPYGTMNPGGFDYEAWVLQEGIRANGYIVNQPMSTLLTSHWYRYSIDRIRQFFQEKIAVSLPPTQTSQWITALTIGERHDIRQADWQVLRNTGTNHLMAIAGLHIGLMAALANVIVSFFWGYIPWLALRIPSPHAGAIAALLMALTYSAMAGFSIPTQRACLMLSVFLVTLLLRRHTLSWQAWSVALFCVLLLNPLSVLTESFWLSFSSVALIIYGVSGRLLPSGLWWKWGRVQWVIAVGLIPWSISLFHQYSFIAFIANSIAIPWVGFVVVPLCFLGCFLLCFSVKAGGFVLIFADKILGVLWHILAWLAHLPGVVWYQTIPHLWILTAGAVGVLFLLFPVGFPGRYLGIIWLLPLTLYTPSVPNKNEVRFTLLDVGQGLSAVVQTKKHILVFDTGAHLSASFDMGDSVLVPFLHSIGAKQVDMLVVSHGDNDHAGGAEALLNQFPVLSIKASVPESLAHAEYCLRGANWNWDGVNFEFLYPPKENLDLGNNSSCVLRVTSGDRHILLTGDIEKLAEKELVANAEYSLPADILIAPHHGSKTSGIDEFVEAVNPHYVLFPLGYRNRYHFPHQTVVTKYQDLHAVLYDTVHTGAMEFVISDNKIMLPVFYRVQHRHYWNN